MKRNFIFTIFFSLFTLTIFANDRAEHRQQNGQYRNGQRNDQRGEVPGRRFERERDRAPRREGSMQTERGHRTYHPLPYQRYFHKPIRQGFKHAHGFKRPIHYFNYINQNHRRALYNHWVLYTTPHTNGFYIFNNYPYFVYDGYQHRYSSYDVCHYQLFDNRTDEVELSFWNQSCQVGYDQCAMYRDNFNELMWENRYSCAENIVDEY